MEVGALKKKNPRKKKRALKPQNPDESVLDLGSSVQRRRGELCDNQGRGGRDSRSPKNQKITPGRISGDEIGIMVISWIESLEERGG